MSTFLPEFSATNPRFFKVIVEETSFIKLVILANSLLMIYIYFKLNRYHCNCVMVFVSLLILEVGFGFLKRAVYDFV